MKLHKNRINVKFVAQLVASVVISLLLVEILLRIYAQYISQAKSVQNTDITILAVGESTTALGGKDSYASQLELLLQSAFVDRNISIQVLNEGIIGTTTDVIVEKLPDLLRKYQPQIVISMMGINDTYDIGLIDKKFIVVNQTGTWIEHLRLYKIYRLLFLSASDFIELFNQLHVTDDISWLNASTRSEIQKQNFVKAERLVRRALSLDKNNKIALLNLMTILSFLSREKELSDTIDIYLARDPENYRSYIELGNFYRTIDRYNLSELMYQKALNLKPDDDWVAGEYGYLLYLEKRIDEAEYYLRKAVERRPEEVTWIVRLANLTRDKHQYNEAQKMYSQALVLEPENKQIILELHNLEMQATDSGILEVSEREIIFEKTTENYIRIKDLLMNNGVIHIAMQYPLRPVDELASIIGADKVTNEYHCHEDITKSLLIDNEQIFKDALKAYTYDELFTDKFAGNFGHATSLGNYLIAENLLNRITPLIHCVLNQTSD